MGRDHPRQGDLFAAAPNSGDPAAMELQLNRQQLLIWQQRLSNFQQPKLDALNQGGQQTTGQINLFGGAVQGPANTVHRLNPLALTPQHLQFWRWPEQQGSGAAIYFVLDRPPHLPGHLLLYVGETAQADRRWKGEHDCKSYLAAYGEALQQAGLSSQPSIRFWHDAPSDVKPRRALEQALIRHWLPPFNKETRRRWATPFTADAG
jgi:hypothetical protein